MEKVPVNVPRRSWRLCHGAPPGAICQGKEPCPALGSVAGRTHSEAVTENRGA